MAFDLFNLSYFRRQEVVHHQKGVERLACVFIGMISRPHLEKQKCIVNSQGRLLRYPPYADLPRPKTKPRCLDRTRDNGDD